MKRIVLLLLVVALFPFRASAASPFKATLDGEARAFLGEEISLTLSFSELPEEGLCGVDLELSFDGSLVSFVSATVSGFPEEGAWCGTGRVSGDEYLYFIFDEHEDAQGFAPVPIKEGDAALVTFTFAAKSVGVAEFSLSAYGAVTGTVLAGGTTASVYGQGNGISIEISKRDCPDMTGDGFTVKDGVMYVRPDATVAELGAEGTLYRADGSIADEDEPFFGGDSFEFTYCNPLPVIIFMDANGDGRFSTADYLRLKLHLKGQMLLTGGALFTADADGDGALTATDAIVLGAALTGTEFPF